MNKSIYLLSKNSGFVLCTCAYARALMHMYVYHSRTPPLHEYLQFCTINSSWLCACAVSHHKFILTMCMCMCGVYVQFCIIDSSGLCISYIHFDYACYIFILIMHIIHSSWLCVLYIHLDTYIHTYIHGYVAFTYIHTYMYTWICGI